MMKNLFIGIFALAFTGISIPVSAQKATLEERISKMESITSKLPSISGFINLRYQYGEDLSSFDIRRARLDFKGDLSSKIDYRLQLELSPSPKIIDAYVRIKLNPAFNIQFGQYKIPFSLENPYSPLTLEVIENARVISKLSNYNDVAGLKANGRDFGLSAYGGLFKQGDFNLVEYSVGIFNGTGINAGDNNKVKDIAGRLEVHPVKALTLSLSGYKGQLYLNENSPHATRDRYGFGLRYDDKTLLFRTEYIKGFTNHLESNGYYALFGYKVTPKLQPLVRYDFFQQDLSADDTRQTDYLVGIDYQAAKNFRFQANYTWQTFEDSGDNNGLLGLMITAMF